MEKEIGLIGFPLSHSFSPRWFQDYFIKNKVRNIIYKLFPFGNIEHFPLLLKNHPLLIGLNVTIPHKQSVIPYLDKLSDEAKAIGAVNCIKIEKIQNQVITTGYNTDVVGFSNSIQPLIKPCHKKAIVFGNGGAAQAVKQALRNLNIDFLVVNRKENPDCILYSELNKQILSSHKIWINTTPLGMFPNVDTAIEIDYSASSHEHLAYDLVYNPEETLFLKKCKMNGASIKNGIEMLHVQAAESANIFGL
ncbi:MAG: shikimate dehydrogenase [Bacteroidetes bacterium]|nr:shikimate dehydrogenase [Bacteroidota bacterium]